MKVIRTLKKLLTSVDRNYWWHCIDCDNIFDGNEPDIFIKHQIDNKHYNCVKLPK